jgi:2-keto-4-pentenoate hydratase
MANPNHESASQFLLAARKRGTPGPRIPLEYRPADTNEGLAIQARMTALVGQPVGGYKCSLPSAPRPTLLAPVFAPTIAYASPCPVLAIDASVRIEPEIAFVMARDLPPRAAAYTESEIRDAIKEARLVLEILGSRYSDPDSATFPEMLADGLANQGLLIGPVLRDPWNAELESLPIVIDSAAGVLAAHEGKHADGHPARPLYWLANYLASCGTPLRAGMIVTTGSYCGAVDVPLDTPLKVAYGNLGTLSATLTRSSTIQSQALVSR